VESQSPRARPVPGATRARQVPDKTNGSASTEVGEGAAPGDAAGQPAAQGPRKRQLLTTGEMARLSNNTLRTVRFYEEEGILRPAGRTEGGHRLFEPAELDRLMLVTDLRLAGLSLDEIRQILEVKRGASSGAEAARVAMRMLGARIEELGTKVAVLSRLRDDLTRTAGIFARCAECKDTTSFPAGCDSCEHLGGPEPRPRSMRVLWGVSPSAPPAEDVTADE
jgi:DNA-binding transcriptional MerR regulator